MPGKRRPLPRIAPAHSDPDASFLWAIGRPSTVRRQAGPRPPTGSIRWRQGQSASGLRDRQSSAYRPCRQDITIC